MLDGNYKIGDEIVITGKVDQIIHRPEFTMLRISIIDPSSNEVQIYVTPGRVEKLEDLKKRIMKELDGSR